MSRENRQKTILVTGATGYVGGQLVPHLLREGYRVRVLIREDAERIAGYEWYRRVEIATGDVLAPEMLPTALQDIDAAYYLIHSMGNEGEFDQLDVRAANNFVTAAAAAGVRRIIYLGGLGDGQEQLSAHLHSRQQTGAALRGSHVPVTEFRAGMIVGSGSLSFELLRSVTEQLPVIIAPPWIDTRSQPVAIEDVLTYLAAALRTPGSSDQVIEIGGADVLTYAQMILTYARVRKMRRFIVRSEHAPSRLFAQWVHWLTPMPASIAAPLAEGIRNELIVRDSLAKKLFPQIVPVSFETAVRRSLEPIERGDIEAWWRNTRFARNGEIKPIYLGQEQGMIVERRLLIVDASQAAVFDAFATLHDTSRWPHLDRLRRKSRPFTRLASSAGRLMERGLPGGLSLGEAVDIWHIERAEPFHTLRVRFQMIMLGKGWLVLEAKQRADGRTDLIQTAYFASKGLPGLAYWYGLYPLHGLILSQMIRDIARRASKIDDANLTAN